MKVLNENENVDNNNNELKENIKDFNNINQNIKENKDDLNENIQNNINQNNKWF